MPPSKQGDFYRRKPQALFKIITTYLSPQHPTIKWGLPKTPVFLWRWCSRDDEESVLHTGSPTPSLPWHWSSQSQFSLGIPALQAVAASSWPFAAPSGIFLAAVIRALVPNKEKSRNWFVSALLEPSKSTKAHGAGHRRGKKHPQRAQMKQEWTSDCLSRQHQPNLIKEPRWWNTLTVSATDLMKDLKMFMLIQSFSFTFHTSFPNKHSARQHGRMILTFTFLKKPQTKYQTKNPSTKPPGLHFSLTTCRFFRTGK